MINETYFKKGAPVIYHYKVWRKIMWSDSGYGWVPEWKRATLVCTPRDVCGRFTSYEPYMAFVTLKDEKGKVFNAIFEDIEPDRDMETLSREELIKMFGQICRGSIYLGDYNNTLGVFNDVVYDWCESFYNHLMEVFGEEEADKQDTAENFAEYVLCGEIAKAS